MDEPEDFDFALEYAAAGCNRRRGSMCTLPSQRLSAYGACSNVIVVRNAGRQVSAALPVHKALITSVVLVEAASAVFLIACAADGCIAVWHCALPADGEEQPWTRWEQLASWEAHGAAAVACDAVWNDTPGSITIASAGLDSRLCLWTVSRECVLSCASECRLLDENQSRPILPECLAMRSEQSVGGSTLLIAVGGTQKSFQLFACDQNLCDIRRICDLRGHGDWILSVAFSEQADAKNRTYIATASKDCSVRIWSISQCSKSGSDDESSISNSHLQTCFSWGGLNWAVAEVALLQEHNAAVQSVHFSESDADHCSSRRLMSASTDGSIAVWTTSENEKWHCESRFGLIGDYTKTVGFFGAVLLSKCVNDVLAHSFGGALHCWRNKNGAFYADTAPDGHCGPVLDGDWGLHGEHFLSCSSDKTVQIIQYAEENERRFVHMARPQVHGHAVQAVAFCDDSGSKFVSGAEETMLRMFEAPAFGAATPELGLSNKAVIYAEKKSLPSDGSNSRTEDTVGATLASPAASLPVEPEPRQGTLWPEAAKLYGHGNPISCVAVCTRLGVLVSACMAQKPRDASIILWDLSNGTEMSQLSVHDRTVTRMAFSPDGLGLLSVSKDRSFALHSVCEKEPFKCRLVHHQILAHNRQLHDGAWLFNRSVVVTCARDKTLRFFSVQDVFESPEESPQPAAEPAKELTCLTYSCGVSAVHASTSQQTGVMHLAAGFEDGAISIFQVTRNGQRLGLDVKPLVSVPAHLQCSGRITKVQWWPLPNAAEELKPVRHLAVTSTDHSVRVLRLQR